MDDRKLHVMLTTLRAGSFGKAALELNCSQSAVTQLIGSMENELGCKLFVRGHSGVTLTPAGEELLPLIEEADACHTRLLEQARTIAQGGLVPIRIAVFSSIAATWFPNVLRDYRKKHPAVTFEIRIVSTGFHQLLKMGEIDVALADKEQFAGFRWYPLMDDPYLAVMPQSMVKEGATSIEQEELGQYPFIWAPLNAVDSLMSIRPTRSMTVSSDENTSLLSMVAQGLGVTVLPALSLQTLPPGVCTLELVPPVKRILAMALAPSPGKSVKEFAAFLRKQIPYVD